MYTVGWRHSYPTCYHSYVPPQEKPWLISLKRKLLCYISRLRNVSTDLLLEQYDLIRNESFRGAFVGSEFHTAYYNSLFPEKEPLVLLKERFLSTPFIMFVRKDPGLVAQLNSHIHNLVSSGLLNHWKDTFLEKTNRKIQQQKLPEILTMSQLEGIVYICIALYLISILIFVVEVICGRTVIQPMMDDFPWRYCWYLEESWVSADDLMGQFPILQHHYLHYIKLSTYACTIFHTIAWIKVF